MNNHRRPSAAGRTSAAGTAAALVAGWLAAAAFLNQLLLRLQLAVGTVGAYAAIICIVMLATAAYTLMGRRFAALDESTTRPDGCDRDHVAHAEEQVDGQVAMLVRAGVDEDAARTLVRDQLVRALTPRGAGGHSIEDVLRRAAEGAKTHAEQGNSAGLYL